MNVIDALERARIEVREKGANVGSGWIGIDCFFCREDRKHLGINREEGFYNCWICGARGPWHRLARELKKRFPGVPWSDVEVGPATRYLDVDYDKLRPSLDTSTAFFSSFDPEEMSDYEWNLWDYLVDERGFEPELMQAVAPLVGLNGPDKRSDPQLRDYVCFRYGDDVIARQTRGNMRGPRWWRSFGGPALWGLEHLRSEPDWVVLCEGVFDALSVPFGRGLAVLGSTASKGWIELLAEQLPRSCRQIVIAFDSNVKAYSKTMNTIRLELHDLGLSTHVWDWDDRRFNSVFDALADEDPNFDGALDLDELRKFGLFEDDDPVLDYLLELIGVVDDDPNLPLF